MAATRSRAHSEARSLGQALSVVHPHARRMGSSALAPNFPTAKHGRTYNTGNDLQQIEGFMNIKTIGVEDWLNVHEKSARIDIAQSTIASLTIDEVLDLGGGAVRDQLARMGQERLSYGWIEGSPAFKQQVASLYHHMDEGNILQTNGATGANMLAIMACISPGDHVVAEAPTYEPLYELPRALGAHVDLWHLRADHSWQPDLKELERLVTPSTKLICINNASNPTGTILDESTLEGVARTARSCGAYVLSDEVYLPLSKTTPRPPSIVDVYERGIATNSLSKTYSVPGIRVGWVATSSPEIAQRVRVLRDYTMICAGVPNDILATHVLEHREEIYARNRLLMEQNRAIMDSWIAREPRASWVPPQGVSCAYIQLDIPMDDEEFCLKVLRERGLLLVPGGRFDLPCGARLGYCAPQETLLAGLTELSGALRAFDE